MWDTADSNNFGVRSTSASSSSWVSFICFITAQTAFLSLYISEFSLNILRID